MNLTNVQKVVFDLIAAHATFLADQTPTAKTVFYDLGFSKSDIEGALESKGYAVAVWPPTKGVRMSDDAVDAVPVDSTLVVRLSVSPLKLKAIDTDYKADNSKPTAGDWFTNLMTSIFQAILSAQPDVGGIRFMLSQDPF